MFGCRHPARKCVCVCVIIYIYYILYYILYIYYIYILYIYVYNKYIYMYINHERVYVDVIHADTRWYDAHITYLVCLEADFAMSRLCFLCFVYFVCLVCLVCNKKGWFVRGTTSNISPNVFLILVKSYKSAELYMIFWVRSSWILICNVIPSGKLT